MLARHPLCPVCEERPSVEAHHVIAVSVDPSMAYEVGNGVGLCAPCHALSRQGSATVQELRALREEELAQRVHPSTLARMRRLLKMC